LSLLFLGVERGSGTFLSKLLDPPSRDAIDAAIFSLSKLGAIAKSSKTNEVVLTALGMHLAGIPAPPPIGKSKCLFYYLSFISICYNLIPETIKTVSHSTK